MTKTIQTEITIHAPKATIWNILMNFKEYPQWNPFIQSISGNTHVGEQLSISLQPPGGSAMKFKPMIQQSEDQKIFSWLGKLFVKGLFDGHHSFTLEALDQNKTRLIHAEQFSGLLVGMINLQKTEDGFRLMNEALKQRAEKIHRSNQ